MVRVLRVLGLNRGGFVNCEWKKKKRTWKLLTYIDCSLFFPSWEAHVRWARVFLLLRAADYWPILYSNPYTFGSPIWPIIEFGLITFSPLSLWLNGTSQLSNSNRLIYTPLTENLCFIPIKYSTRRFHFFFFFLLEINLIFKFIRYDLTQSGITLVQKIKKFTS